MRREHLVALLLVIVVAGVFFEVPSMDFVRWDDQVNVYENPYYRPVTPDAVADLWEEPYVGFYLPLTRTVWAAIACATQPAARDMALQLNPRSWEAHANLGAILLERGEEDAALRRRPRRLVAPPRPRASPTSPADAPHSSRRNSTAWRMSPMGSSPTSRSMA